MICGGRCHSRRWCSAMLYSRIKTTSLPSSKNAVFVVCNLAVDVCHRSSEVASSRIFGLWFYCSSRTRPPGWASQTSASTPFSSFRGRRRTATSSSGLTRSWRRSSSRRREGRRRATTISWPPCRRTTAVTRSTTWTSWPKRTARRARYSSSPGERLVLLPRASARNSPSPRISQMHSFIHFFHHVILLWLEQVAVRVPDPSEDAVRDLQGSVQERAGRRPLWDPGHRALRAGDRSAQRPRQLGGGIAASTPRICKTPLNKPCLVHCLPSFTRKSVETFFCRSPQYSAKSSSRLCASEYASSAENRSRSWRSPLHRPSEGGQRSGAARLRLQENACRTKPGTWYLPCETQRGREGERDRKLLGSWAQRVGRRDWWLTDCRIGIVLQPPSLPHEPYIMMPTCIRSSRTGPVFIFQI